MKKYLLIGSLAYLYVLLRAIMLDITHDESITLRIFVPQSFAEILSYQDVNPNNHLLNTISVKALFGLFGESVFVSRIPSLLAFLIYLIYAAKTAHYFLKPFTGTLLFICLIANPFVLDFFSVSRGYGLSIGFLLGSIYYLLAYLKTQSIGHSVLTILFASLGTLSSFSLINYWVAVYFVILVSPFILRKAKEQFWKITGYLQLQFFILASLLYLPFKGLLHSDSLYYGGVNGFFDDTIHSLVIHSIGAPFDNESELLLAVILSLFIITLFISSLIIAKPRPVIFFDHRIVLGILIVIPILSTVTQHYLFDVRYLIDRTALFFLPLTIVLIFFSIDAVIAHNKWKLYKFVGVSFSLILILNLSLNLSLFKTITWEHDSRTREVLAELNEIGKVENRQINLCSSWPFNSSIFYYKERGFFPNVNYVFTDWDKIEDGSEYVLYYARPLMFIGYLDFIQPIHNYSKDTVLCFPSEHIYLFNNLEPQDSVSNR